MSFTRCLAAVFASVATCSFAAPNDAKFDSYTKAYEQAGKLSQPMLVILNPAKGAENCVNVEEMALDSALTGYVVAEIDTTTDHGKKVHELFKSPSLPHVVVIDNNQQKQIYKTSRSLSSDELSNILATYRNGAPQTVTAGKPIIESGVIPSSGPVLSTPSFGAPLSIQSYPGYAPPADCPSCRRNAGYQF